MAVQELLEENLKKETVWVSVFGIVVASYFCGIASHALERHEVFAWAVAAGLFMRILYKELPQ